LPTLQDAPASPPGSSPYRAAAPLIGLETFQLLYDFRKPTLAALSKCGETRILDGRRAAGLIKYGKYVEVDRVAANALLLAHLPVLNGGGEAPPGPAAVPACVRLLAGSPSTSQPPA